MVLDTFSLMPGWAQFLIIWPLPSLITALIMRLMWKKDLNSEYGYIRKQQVREIVTVFSTAWPLFYIIVLVAAIIETYEYIPEQWNRFDKWTKTKHKAHQLYRKVPPPTKTRPEHIHMSKTKPNGTVCGVGNYKEVKTTPFSFKTTCPICLDIMQRNQRN